MTNPTKTLPRGAVEIGGRAMLGNTKGGYDPVDLLKPQTLLQHELAYQLTDYALDLSAEIARFLSYTYADVAAFDALLAQEYGVERDEESRGNRTYTSADGLRQVKIAVADRVAYGPELQVAKRLLEEIIQARSADADPLLLALVNRAFKTDKEGKVAHDDLLALRKMDLPDDRWPDVCRAIDDAQRPAGTSRYVRFYERKRPDEKFQLIVLDIASVETTPEAFSRKGVREQLREAQESIWLERSKVNALYPLLVNALSEARKAGTEEVQVELCAAIQVLGLKVPPPPAAAAAE